MNWVTDGIWRCNYLHWFILFLLAYRSNPLGYATARCQGFPAWKPRSLWSSTPQQMQVKLNSIDGPQVTYKQSVVGVNMSSIELKICRFHWLWINCDLLQSTSFVPVVIFIPTCASLDSNVDRMMLSMFHVIDYGRVQTVKEMHIFDVNHYGMWAWWPWPKVKAE